MPKNKFKITRSAFKLSPQAVKYLWVLFILAILFLAAWGFTWNILRTSKDFLVREIVSKDNSADFSYLKGKNIFALDLKREGDLILNRYPDCVRIKLIRVLPNRLYVDFIQRKALGLIKLSRYFAVDQEGTLFYPPAQFDQMNLPVISGLESKLYAPKPAKRYNIPELNLALEILQEVLANKQLRNFKISRIDVSQPMNAWFLIPVQVKMPGSIQAGQDILYENMEVKIGYGNIKQKILILAGLLSQGKGDLASIKYVDLRFKEPVIKLKNVQ
jgi:hypothetical protein